jgi:hypothetical protein
MSIISAGGAVTGADVGPTIDPRDYFGITLYAGSTTGTGQTQNITHGQSFTPEFVWIKNRSAAHSHQLYDIVRGYGSDKNLKSNNTDEEGVFGGTNGYVSAVSSSQITTVSGTQPTAYGEFVNQSTRNYVAWCWKANGAGVSNTAGTITSTVSANTDSGFSIVQYTGATSSTVGHGLSQRPEFIMVKRISNNTDNWVGNHIGLSNGDNGLISLNTTNAEGSISGYWGTIGASTFGTGSNPAFTNATNDAHIAYCFHSVDGFSKFGAYTGNGSATGPSITTDFEPTFLMIKRTDSTGDWIIHDSARDATNPRTAFLEPNTTDAEGSGLDVDFNSTSFQIKSSSATVNANGGTYIYMCIA